MKVILTEKVKSLGNVGEIHNVSPGFARNFLFPKRLAMVADESNTKALEDQKKALSKKMSEEKNVATAIKAKLDGKTVTIEKKVGGSGRLFGTVTASEVASILTTDGIEVEKRQVLIETPIKQLGTFEIKAKLFQDVEATFSVKVEKDAKQIEDEKKKAAMKAKAPKVEKKKEESTEENSENTEEAAE